MRRLALAAVAAGLLASSCTCAGGEGGAAPAGTAAGGAPPASSPAPAIPPYPPPPAPAAPTPVPLAPPPVPPAERELLEAYARYWEVYSAALAALDASRLPEVMTGPRLQRAREEIARLRLSGHAVRIDVESAPIVGMLLGEEAVVVDRYLNQSYLVDAETGLPVAARGVANAVHATVSLVREEGSWKVRESRRERAP